ncbi:LPS-assembly protein LptD [Anaeromyxobacter sp. Fw109-5]|uniref:LPS-assembly protein LptD n=1 Tax=Anaeromyxobacter sp. (strain Fw109-5) TaxID=404589 RepID=UPI0000ED741B|nr:LPS-assembly protein LptD [Anaeromyxobacter sp. Fw109-5]ABS26709.1 organic solvent tolerance protein OstA-like protein [Anaeromyxobacter sp. Fw109-5]
MRRAVLLATIALAARLAAAQAPETRARPDAGFAGDVRVEAGTVTYDAVTGGYLVEDGAVLRRGSVVLRARTARYDPATGEVVATGGVLLTDSTRAVAADGVTAVLGGPFEAEDVVAFLKDGPVALGEAESIEAARDIGRNRLSFSGTKLHGDPAGRLRLSGARLTLCDCGAGRAPSWELRARGADVIPGRRATLSWPILYVTPRFLFVDRPVPVLPLPWLYLPLGDRQTGLLLPQIASSSATGFAVELPVFVTLGRSADLTLRPAYALGRGREDVAKGNPAVRGPILRLEGRWTPAAGSRGQAELTWLDDLDAEPGGESGNRYALSLSHAERFSERTSIRADVALYGDPFLPRDFSTDVLARGTSYRRSDLIATHAREALVLEGGASYLQPLLVSSDDYGLFGSDFGSLHRLPWASATLLPAMFGPLRVDGRAGLTRFGWAGDAPGVAAYWRSAASRADARLELALPLMLGSAATLEPFARGAAVGYGFEGPDADDPAANVWGIAGARLETAVGRRYGEVHHRVSPRIEWRVGTDRFGEAGLATAYDAYDRTAPSPVYTWPVPGGPPLQLAWPVLSAAPPGRFHQLRAAVDTRLSVRGADALRLELGQDFDLEAGRFGETFANGTVRAGPFSLDATARFLAIDGRTEPVPFTGRPARTSSPLDRLTELRATASVADRRGDVLRLGLLSIGRGSSGALVAGLDPLFDLRPAPIEAVAQGNAGITGRMGGATATYDVLFPGRPEVRQCPGEAPREVGALHVQQHVASVAWESLCRCFSAAAFVSVNDCGDVSYRASLDLSRLGSTLTRATR